ncbi:hypothetical protein [Nocardia jejuensis]|uniref:hypothetical protein n=1 Tax=Nocardia jejuensis TaxID=328049 RepID=UPI000834ED38|nr:hypothetical protein [Nocardia jejuensis]
MTVSIAQLRAVLAILNVYPEDVIAPMGSADHREQSERAMLIGLLHARTSGELRRMIDTTEETAASVIAHGVGSSHGEDVWAQADFDSRWLRDRVELLAAAATVDPTPILLDAAARSADATAALLALSRNPNDPAAEYRWQRALHGLGQAYRSINDEYIDRSNTVTAPLRQLI